MDQLDRSRKRGDGPPRRRRGRGDRPAAPKMGRAALARRRGEARTRACTGRSHRVSRGQGGEMAIARRRHLLARDAARRHRQGAEDPAEGDVQGPPPADGVSAAAWRLPEREWWGWPASTSLRKLAYAI